MSEDLRLRVALEGLTSEDRTALDAVAADMETTLTTWIQHICRCEPVRIVHLFASPRASRTLGI